MTEEGSSINLFLLHQNSKGKHQSEMSALSARECDPLKGYVCIYLRTRKVILKCQHFQALESALKVIKGLLIALHVFHG